MPNERSVELPWLLAQTLTYPVLDVGHAESTYLCALAEHGPVDGIDVRQVTHPCTRRDFQADITTWQAPALYQTVIALSTVEHIGLEVQAYGTPAGDPEGDVRAIEGCWRALAPGGTLLVTVPFGVQENRGWYRVYSQSGMDALMGGLTYTRELITHPEWAVGGVALITARKP